MKEPFISIVIPAYNEGGRIEGTLRRIWQYIRAREGEAPGWSIEVIVVDDGSTDETKEIVKNFAQGKENIRLLENEENQGKGFSVRRGILKARGRYVLFSDADLSTPIEELEKLVRRLEDNYDLVIASRRMPESRAEMPFLRRFLGKGFNLLVRAIAVRGIKDTQCGFKCFKREVAERIFPKITISRMGFDVEILYIARKYGYKIAEVPVQWTYAPLSRTKLLKDPLEMLKDLIGIRLKDWQGRYD